MLPSAALVARNSGSCSGPAQGSVGRRSRLLVERGRLISCPCSGSYRRQLASAGRTSCDAPLGAGSIIDAPSRLFRLQPEQNILVGRPQRVGAPVQIAGSDERNSRCMRRVVVGQDELGQMDGPPGFLLRSSSTRRDSKSRSQVTVDLLRDTIPLEPLMDQGFGNSGGFLVPRGHCMDELAKNVSHDKCIFSAVACLIHLGEVNGKDLQGT